MHLFTIVMLGVSTNLDNLCLGLSYGINRKIISWYQNMAISAISGLLSFMACAATQILPHTYRTAFIIIGSIILIAVGTQTIIAAVTKKTCVETINILRLANAKEVFWLGVVLALNALAVSFGAGLTEVPAIPIGLSIFAFSLISIFVGCKLGIAANNFVKSNWLNIASGTILIAIGILEIFV